MGRLFGTDGVRGEANREITAELALKLAVAVARVLPQQIQTKDPNTEALNTETLSKDASVSHKENAITNPNVNPLTHAPRLRAAVGRDPRASGEFLSAAMCAGLASAGIDVVDVGSVPTPAVAFITKHLGFDFGVMISASHNPMQDNGIKFFDGEGFKLEDAIEDQIEATLNEPWDLPTGAGVGRISQDHSLVHRYVEHIVASIPNRLDGLKVVVDAANGAASEVGPEALRQAGAQVVVIGSHPDGSNINDGYGATNPRRMAAAVVGHWAHAGVSFDGDADRCIAADEDGQIVDGDQIMGILAQYHLQRGTLAKNTLVTTVMSNLGLKLAMRSQNIDTVETAVGDRYVLEEMRRGGYTLGGEQSGHILMTDVSTTGDGILTALHLLSYLANTRQQLSELAGNIKRLPQIMINVPNVDKARAISDVDVLKAVSDAEMRLGDSGRVLLRPSGTEPLVRVMVEAETQDQANEVAQELADVVSQRLVLS